MYARILYEYGVDGNFPVKLMIERKSQEILRLAVRVCLSSMQITKEQKCEFSPLFYTHCEQSPATPKQQ